MINEIRIFNKKILIMLEYLIKLLIMFEYSINEIRIFNKKYY